MNEGDVGALLRLSMVVMLKLGGPLMVVALLIGVVVALLQAVTQVNEAALSFVPKVVALFFALLLLGPFMLSTLTDFTHQVFDGMVAVGGS